MSKLAKEAISKEEKAVLQLIGTADSPGTLSKIKDLMQASGSANIGPGFHSLDTQVPLSHGDSEKS